MTIADQINRLSNAKANIKQAIENKGVTVDDSALLDEYPALIDSIEIGGGNSYYEELYNQRTKDGTTMAGMFAYCTAPALDLRKLDNSNVTNMNKMFYYCSSSVNIDGWNTSKVTNMSYMFDNFTGSVDISKLDTSNVTNTTYMFYYTNIDKIILTGLSFPSATSLDYMFSSATGTILDLSSWDISNITKMENMFNGTTIKKIDLTGWVTTKVTSMTGMFNKYGDGIEELIIPDWDMTNTTNYSGFFNASYTKKLKLIDLSRSNDITITKIASTLPTRTTSTYGDVIVPYNTSQAVIDALIAKYWRPMGAELTSLPTSIEIATELDEIMPGDSTKVYLGAYEPWHADTSKVEIVVSDNSMATLEDNKVISTGIVGDIVLEARIIDTQEVLATKTIAVSETDSYPNLVKFRLANTPSSSSTIITVNGSSKKLSALTYDKYSDIYSYDNGAPITSIKFERYSYINELIKLNTSNITNMYQMFYYCQSLTSLDLSNWDTGNVTNMESMFNYCDKLTSLDVNNWDTSKVKNMRTIFYQCKSLITVSNISSWNTGKVTDIASMFFGCNNLTSLDLSNWDIGNVTNISSMFEGCSSLQTLNLSNWHTDSFTSRGDIFKDCTSLHTLRLDNCDNRTIDLFITANGFPTNVIEGVTRTIYCKEENAAGLSAPGNWVFSYVEEEEPEIPEVSVDPPEEEISLYVLGEFKNNQEITEVRTMVDNTHDDLSEMFYACSKLVSINTEDWDVSNVTTMEDMFTWCLSLTTLDLSNWNVSKVKDMFKMFFHCEKLTELDVNGWDIGNVTNMGQMFSECKSLTDLDLSSWDIGNVTEMTDMLYNCTSLTNLQAPKNISAPMGFGMKFMGSEMGYPTKLTHESLMSIINNLATVTETKTMNIGSKNLAKLSEEDIAIATNKNWKLT